MFREREVKLMKTSLLNGNSVSLYGIRRSGKSSLLKHVKVLLEKDHPTILPVYLDCQDYDDPSSLFLEILEHLPNGKKKLWDRFSSSLPKQLRDLEKLKVGAFVLENKKSSGDYWKSIVKIVQQVLEACREDNLQVILFLDELPFLIENLKEREYKTYEIQQVLATLKSWRNTGIPMVLCGSVNIQSVLQSLDLSDKLLAGCRTQMLELLTKDEARQVIEELLKGTPVEWWSEGVTEKVLEIIPDYLPYFLQYTFQTLSIEEHLPQDFEEIYSKYVYTGIYRDFIYQFDERLDQYSKEERKQVEKTLDDIAKGKEEKLLDDTIIRRLENDEFIQRQTISNKEVFQFSLKLLKDWWIKKRHLKIDK